jgi:hypothetical protein
MELPHRARLRTVGVLPMVGPRRVGPRMAVLRTAEALRIEVLRRAEQLRTADLRLAG